MHSLPSRRFTDLPQNRQVPGLVPGRPSAVEVDVRPEHQSVGGTQMTENSTNEHVVRRLFDALDAGDEAAVDELLAPDFVLHTAAPGYSPDGRGLKALAVDWRAVMPDWQQHL